MISFIRYSVAVGSIVGILLMPFVADAIGTTDFAGSSVSNNSDQYVSLAQYDHYIFVRTLGDGSSLGCTDENTDFVVFGQYSVGVDDMTFGGHDLLLDESMNHNDFRVHDFSSPAFISSATGKPYPMYFGYVECLDSSEGNHMATFIYTPDANLGAASSSPVYVQDSGKVLFALAILIVIGFLMVIGFMFNSLTSKKPWL